MIKYNWIY